MIDEKSIKGSLMSDEDSIVNKKKGVHLNWEDLDRVNLFKMAAFQALSVHGTLKRAAESLDISLPRLFHAIKSLSKDIKKKLYINKRQQIVLTEDGRNFAAFCAEVLNLYELKNFNNVVDCSNELVIASHHGISELHVSRAILLLHKEHPNMKFKMLIGKKYMDFIEGDVDIVIGPRLDNRGDLGQLFLNKLEYYFYGSPEYLEKRGCPKNFKDLEDHNLLIYCVDEAEYVDQVLNLKNKFFESNCYHALINLALNDGGLIPLTQEQVDGYKIKSSQLKKVNIDEPCDFDTLYFLYKKTSKKQALIQAFKEKIFALLGEKK